MQESHYMNSLPARRMERVGCGCSIGRSKIYKLIGVNFILLCIIQSALNVYLWHESVGNSKSLNVSTCNLTLLKEVQAVISERDQLLIKEQQYLKQIDQLLQEKNEVLEKNKQLNQDQVKLHTENKQLKQEKHELFNEKRELLQNNSKLENETNKLLQEKELLLHNKRELEIKNNELLQENKQLNQDQVKLQTENKKLRQEKCEIYQEKCKLQQQKDLLEKENKKLKDRIVEKENQILNLRARIKMVESKSSECPLGWHRFMSSCYQLSTEPNTWINAKQNCESKGAQLMIMNDETEQRPFIGGVVKIWIGLYGQTENYSSFWYLKGVDGRLLKSGGPNTRKPKFWTSLSQSCVYIDQSLPCMRTWSMGTCMEKFYWICEKQMNTNGFQLY